MRRRPDHFCAASFRKVLSHMADCIVFYDVYSALKGPLAGLTPTNCCTWDPRLVVCDQDNIVQIALMNMALTGTLSPRIGELKKLTRLSLKWNEITGPIPDTLGDLEFAVLQLDYNKLTGSIPKNLKFSQPASFVSFRFNQLTGPIPTNFPLNSMFAGTTTTPICPFDPTLCHDEPSTLKYCVGLAFPKCTTESARPSPTGNSLMPPPGTSPEISPTPSPSPSTPTIQKVTIQQHSFLEENKIILSVAGTLLVCLLAVGIVLVFIMRKSRQK
jgi:hypothetical protein